MSSFAVRNPAIFPLRANLATCLVDKHPKHRFLENRTEFSLSRVSILIDSRWLNFANLRSLLLIGALAWLDLHYRLLAPRDWDSWNWCLATRKTLTRLRSYSILPKTKLVSILASRSTKATKSLNCTGLNCLSMMSLANRPHLSLML